MQPEDRRPQVSFSCFGTTKINQSLHVHSFRNKSSNGVRTKRKNHRILNNGVQTETVRTNNKVYIKFIARTHKYVALLIHFVVAS